MNIHRLKELWKREELFSFNGWDFSHLENRWDHQELPWDYKSIVLQYLQSTDSLLDMGTGGGEFLLTLHHPYLQTCVTESYPPNIALCKKILSPRGITVKQISNTRKIPYESDTFDIVIARHESFNADEVSRVLKAGGYFVTQQVGSQNNNDLSKRLISDFTPRFPDNNLNNNLYFLQKAGFQILLSKEAFPKTKFYDIGAIVFVARIIEWEFPDFSVDSCFDALCALQEELQNKGFISSTAHRFVIVAKKKNNI